MADPDHKLYVTYQRSFRDDHAAIEAEWTHKLAAERIEIASAIHVTDRANTEHLAAHHRVASDLKWIRAALARRPRDLGRLHERIDCALHPLDDLHLKTETLVQAWRDLAQLEEDQWPSSSPESLQHARDRRNHWTAMAEGLEKEIAELQEFLVAYHAVPRDRAGRRPVPPEWPQRGIKSDRVRAVRAQVDDRAAGRLGLEERRQGVTWLPWREVSGGMSTGYLWLCFDDASQRVVDRVFRKDVVHSDDEWHDLRRFDGDLRDVASKTPWELSCHNAVQDVRNCENVVRLRGGRNRELIDFAHKAFRMYVDWCPHDDLQRLFARYVADEDDFPEPFLWNVFECLADSAKAMADGDMEDGMMVGGWGEIVHRDIKLSNIFLSLPDPDRYPQYPRGQLADFGLAFKTRPDESTNPELWAGSGTDGCFAPEQCRYYDRTTTESLNIVPLSVATNIYGIGAVLAVLMAQPRNHEQPIWLGDGDERDTLYSLRIPEEHDGSRCDQYSRQLKALVNRCLSFRPEDRPDAEELRRLILEAVAEGPARREDEALRPDLARGMRSGRAARGERANEARRLMLLMAADDYQLQMARNRLPPQILNDD